MVGIDPKSDGLARAARLGVPDDARGHRGPAKLPELRGHRDGVRRHLGAARISHNNAVLAADGKKVIDLTPAAIGPFTIPRGQLATPISTRRTSTWSPAAARRRSRWSSPCRASPTACIYARDRRLHRVEVRRARHPRQHRRVHRDHVAAPSRSSAAPSTARRSSSSIPPSRR